MNFKHLHYFWVTAQAGGIMRAGEQLHTTPQTLSGQIKLLEDWLGRKLFRKSGRQLELTDDGRVALGYADQIFTPGRRAGKQPAPGARRPAAAGFPGGRGRFGGQVGRLPPAGARHVDRLSRSG